jgi:hypothetical protein
MAMAASVPRAMQPRVQSSRVCGKLIVTFSLFGNPKQTNYNLKG